MSNTILLGPSESGKTTLLGAVDLAIAVSALNKNDDGQPVFDCSIKSQMGTRFDKAGKPGPPEPTMRQLTQSVRKAVHYGTLDDAKLKITFTNVVTVYRFDLTVDLQNTEEKRAANYPPSVEGSFTVYDSPGEAVFEGDPPRFPEAKAVIIEAARKANALIICADPNDRQSIGRFFDHLRTFLEDDIGTPFPFERIAIILTKADQFALEKGWGKDELIKDNEHKAATRARAVLSTAGMDTLLKHHRRSGCEVVCGWASAYGFVGNNQQPNFKRNPPTSPPSGPVATPAPPHTSGRGGTFANYKSGMDVDQIIADWRPFHILDPFVFALTGRWGSLVPVEQE